MISEFSHPTPSLMIVTAPGHHLPQGQPQGQRDPMSVTWLDEGVKSTTGMACCHQNLPKPYEPQVFWTT